MGCRSAITLSRPDSAGLFRAAIIASGPCQLQADVATAETRSGSYAARLGCGDVATAAACLRALPAADLVEPPGFVGFGGDMMTGPVSGTPLLPVKAVTALEAGRAARVPVLIGTTHDEFTLYMAIQYLQAGTCSGRGGLPAQLAEHLRRARGVRGPALSPRPVRR